MRSCRAPLWRQFAAEIIVTCVRWYLRFSLSLRDVEELMAERSLAVDHATIWRWAQTYAPEVQRRLRGLSQMNPARTGPMRLRLILRNSSAGWQGVAYQMAYLGEHVRNLQKLTAGFERREPKLTEVQNQQLEGDWPRLRCSSITPTG
jgi:hypothetical protein